MKLSELGERKLIERIRRTVRNDRSVVRGIGDDCAVLSGEGKRFLLFASDMLVEKVHFLRTAAPEAIGWKALAVNLSDVASMGGIPRHAVISIGLPPSTSVAFVDGLYRGLRRCAARFGVNLVGGDTDRASEVVLDVAILGEVERQRVVYRSGARAGDMLLVTGRLGGAVRSGRHLSFLPRVQEARAIGELVRPHAMMDLSDGLGPDLLRLCEASQVSAWVELAHLPLHKGSSVVQALTEGEDFELLLAVAPSDGERLLRWAPKNLRCGLHRIGQVLPRKRNVSMILQAPQRMKFPASLSEFRHF